MEKKKKIAAILLAVAVLLVVLYSALFIAAETNHDCTGENCPICYQINVCQNALKNLSSAVCTAILTAAFIHTLCKNILICRNFVQNYTLVSLKVKLSD